MSVDMDVVGVMAAYLPVVRTAGKYAAIKYFSFVLVFFPSAGWQNVGQLWSLKRILFRNVGTYAQLRHVPEGKIFHHYRYDEFDSSSLVSWLVISFIFSYNIPSL